MPLVPTLGEQRFPKFRPRRGVVVYSSGWKLCRGRRVTVFLNGILVQHNEEIRGETRHRALPAYNKQVNTGPLALGGHGCPVRFRNIWLRRL
jgi:hypothetical protein